MIVKYKCIICTIIYVICVYTHKHIEGEEDKWRNGNSLKITFDGTSLAVQQLRLQFFGHLMRRANSLEKILMLGKIKGKRKRG